MIGSLQWLTELTLKHSILCASAALIALAGATAPAHAQEAAKSAVGKATAVEQKTAGAVKRGVDKAASGVQYGGKKTSEALHRGASKVGVPSKPASSPAAPQTSK